MLAAIVFATYDNGCALCSAMQSFVKATVLVALIVMCIIAVNLALSVLLPLFVLYVLPTLVIFTKVGIILGGCQWLLKVAL